MPQDTPKRVIKNRFKELLAAKSRREGRKISQRQAAEEMGLSRYLVDRYAANQVDNYNTETMQIMCDYLGCALGDFLVVEIEDSESKRVPLAAVWQ